MAREDEALVAHRPSAVDPAVAAAAIDVVAFAGGEGVRGVPRADAGGADAAGAGPLPVRARAVPRPRSDGADARARRVRGDPPAGRAVPAGACRDEPRPRGDGVALRARPLGRAVAPLRGLQRHRPGAGRPPDHRPGAGRGRPGVLRRARHPAEPPDAAAGAGTAADDGRDAGTRGRASSRPGSASRRSDRSDGSALPPHSTRHTRSPGPGRTGRVCSAASVAAAPGSVAIRHASHSSLSRTHDLVVADRDHVVGRTAWRCPARSCPRGRRRARRRRPRPPRRRPARRRAAPSTASGSVAGSTPITLASLAYQAAMPADQTAAADRDDDGVGSPAPGRRAPRRSCPGPATTAGWSYGCMNAAPVSNARSSHAAYASA